MSIMYHTKRNHLLKLLLSGILVMFVFSSTFYSIAAPGTTLREKFGASTEIKEDTSDITAPLYQKTVAEYISSGYQPYTGDPIVLKAEDSNALPSQIQAAYQGYESNAVLWENKEENIDWTFDILKDGLYNIEISYFATERIGGAAPLRGIMIDGKVPYSEVYSIKFYKTWKDSSGTRLNINGDEINSQQEQFLRWQNLGIIDSKGIESAPLQFLLKKGPHKLTLLYEDGDIVIGNINVKAPAKILPYKEVLEGYSTQNYSRLGQSARVEAEDMLFKNDSAIRRSYDGNPATSPFVYGKVRLNSVSGGFWKKENQEATWSFEVKKAGLYKIAMRFLQLNTDGLNSCRQIMIDNQVPFKEFEEYRFEYDKSWQTKALGDETDGDYLIYLEEGIHTISMAVKLGEMGSVIREIEQLSSQLALIIRNIVKVTGSEPDLNFRYELDKKMPGLLDEIQAVRDGIAGITDELHSFSKGKNTSAESSLLSISDGMKEMISAPDIIPSRLSDLITNQETISQWYIALQEQPLSIDYIEFIPPDEKIDVAESSIWQMLHATYSNFIASFFKDYKNITLNGNTEGMVKLSVWAARGREWSEIIQRMSDEEFSAGSDIVAKINLMPAGSMGTGGSSPLLLAIASGKTPDVVLGSDSLTPVELAVRGATYDLSQFDSFDTVSKRFLDGAFTPLRFNGGVYALPDTQDFMVMFYRKDILAELNISPPETWEELYKNVLPILKQSNYDFYYSGGLYPYLFQGGGNPYKENGLKSDLASNEGYNAFLQWVQNYTIYELPTSANFFIHFRVGDIPIGTGSFNDYVFFSVAAPEIYGKWGITLIPGTRRADNTIDHSAGGGITTNFILNNSSKKEEGWKFLDWWTSTETQIKFGNEVESTIGTEARWNTANIEALSYLPWNKEDLKVIEETHKWYKEVPVVPGGYMTARQINNAWTRVVLNNMNPRDSIEKSVKEIDKELYKKHLQYKLIKAE